MECNKDEASKAKEIAEKKIESGDYFGARKFALKAKSMYPSLDGIKHTIAAIDVYLSAEERVGDKSDWYKVLNVQPEANVDEIKKEYHRLALLVHPDKSKGADGAFKLISDAWDVLSDNRKRFEFDKVRNQKKKAAPGGSRPKAEEPKPKAEEPKPKAASKKEESSNPTSTTSNQQKYTQSGPTFWTMCSHCSLKQKYFRIYINQNLVCLGRNCNTEFCARECAPPDPKTNPPHPEGPEPSHKYQAKYFDFSKQFNSSINAQPSSGIWENPFSDTAQETLLRSKRKKDDALDALLKEREKRYADRDKRRKPYEDPNGGKGGPEYEDPNAGKGGPEYEDPNAGKGGPEYEDPNTGKEGPEYEDPNAGKEGPEYEDPNAGKEGPEYEDPNAGKEGPEYEDPNAGKEGPELD